MTAHRFRGAPDPRRLNPPRRRHGARPSRPASFRPAARSPPRPGLAALALPALVQAQTVVRGPYLQSGTPSSVIVKWRTDETTDSVVRYGLAPDSLTLSAANSDSTTEHEVEVTGLSALSADVKYFYSVDSAGTAQNVDTLTIVDVTNKADQVYFLLGDESDEAENPDTNTRTYLWDVSDLDEPALIGSHDSTTTATDHNQYVKGSYTYQSNYRAGLRILDITDIANGNLTEVAFFDVDPGSDSSNYDDGAWSNYPFFDSGIVTVSVIEQGLFILRPNLVDGVNPALSSASVNGGALTLTYGEALDESSTPATDAFTVTVAGSGRTVTHVSVSGRAVTLTLASAVTDGQEVTVTYTVPGTNPIRDAAGNAAEGLSNDPARNDTPDTTPPTISIVLSPGHGVPLNTAITATVTLDNLDPASYSSLVFRADLTEWDQAFARSTHCEGKDTGKDITMEVDASRETITVEVWKSCSQDIYAYFTLDAALFRLDTSAPGGRVELASAETRFAMSRYLQAGQTAPPPPAPGVAAWLDPNPTSFEWKVGESVVFRARTDILQYLNHHVGVRGFGSEDGARFADDTNGLDAEEACRNVDDGIVDWRRAIHQPVRLFACRAGEATIRVWHETDPEVLATYEFRIRPNDDDVESTIVTLTLDPLEVSESARSRSVRVTGTLDGGARPTATVVAVTVGSGGDSAAEGEDYAEVPELELTIPANGTDGTVTFTLRPTNDRTAEGTETISVRGDVAGLTVTPAELAIADDDTVSTRLDLSLNPSTVSEAAAPTEVVVTASLDAGARTSDTVVTVTVGAAGDSATGGSDYAYVSTLAITVPANETAGQTRFTLRSQNDAIAEGAETISVGGRASGLAVEPATLTLSDDDAASRVVTLAVEPESVLEDTPADVTVTASLDAGARAEDTQVRLTVGAAGDTAVPGTDYARVPERTLTVLSGEMIGTATFRLEPLDNDSADGARTLSVTGSTTVAELRIEPASGARIALADDDSPALRQVSFASAEVSAPEGSTATLTVVINRPRDAATTVRYVLGVDADPATPDADAADHDGMDGAVTIATGAAEARIGIVIGDDPDIEPPRESFTVSLQATEAQLQDFGLGVATVRVTIDEGVCDRTRQVRNALRRSLPCAAVSATDVGGRRDLDLANTGLAALQGADLSGLSALTVLDLSGNALTSLPEGLFAGLGTLEEVQLQDNPGAPFVLRLDLVRTDAAPWAPAPARVVARVREGAPFAMRAALSAVNGTLSPATALVPAGMTAGAPMAVVQDAAGATRVTAAAPAVPDTRCGLLGTYRCFRGIATTAGGTLVLFKAPPTVTDTPSGATLAAEGDAARMDLSALFAASDGGALTYVARSSDPTLATASVAGDTLTLASNEDGREGAVTITVTATDEDGLSVTLTFEVTVESIPRGLLRGWRRVLLEQAMERSAAEVE